MTRDLVTLGGFAAICAALLHFDAWLLLLFLGAVFVLAGLIWRPPDKRKPG